MFPIAALSSRPADELVIARVARGQVILPGMESMRHGAAAIILNDEGHVLLVKQSYGHLNWDLPGGGAESGESIVETALREVREETGLRVVAERTTGVYCEPATDFLHFVFLCRRVGTKAEFRFDAEVTECGYWSPHDLPRPISDFTVQRIQDALSGESQLLPVSVGPRQWLK